jgi:enoyl-CoA hydratase
MDSPQSDILFERRGAAGIVRLNRPQALNAVTHEMVRALARQLAAWASDAAVTRVIITAAGERPSRPAATSARSTSSAAPGVRPRC